MSNYVKYCIGEKCPFLKTVDYCAINPLHQTITIPLKKCKLSKEELQEGKIEVSITELSGIGVMSLRHPVSYPQWEDIVFNIAYYENEYAVEDDLHDIYTICYVDNGGIIKAIKMATLSPEVSNWIHKIVKKQLKTGFIPDFEKKVQNIYARYPDPKDLLKVSFARCELGD